MGGRRSLPSFTINLSDNPTILLLRLSTSPGQNQGVQLVQIFPGKNRQIKYKDTRERGRAAFFYR